MFGKEKKKEVVKEVKEEKSKEEKILDPEEIEPKLVKEECCPGQSEECEEEIDYAAELDSLADVDNEKGLRDRKTAALMVKSVSEVSQLRETVLLLLQRLEKKDADILVLKERSKYLQSAYNRDCLQEIR